MASRFYSEFPEKKVPGGRGAKTGARRAAPASWDGRERTAAWPDPGPHRPSSFNRATKAPVVKTRTAKGGLD